MQNLRHPCGLIVLVALLLGLGGPVRAQSTDIQSLIAAGRLDEMRWPNFASARPLLQQLYQPKGFAPLWLNGPQPKPVALSLIGTFQRAGDEGLDPEDYDASRWTARLAALKQSAAAQARFDVALSVSAMRYASALHRGRVNPQSIHRTAFDTKPFDPAAFLRDRLLASADLPAALASVEPPFAAYRRTRQALLRYLQLARIDDGERLPLPRKTVDPGQTYPGVPRLIRLLRLLGDLPPGATVSPDAQTYDVMLSDAVKRFQRRHGLEADGRLGAATILQLNVPLQQRVQQLQLSLERWRWLPAGISGPAIFVNIPDFRLRAVDRSGIALDMRVVVGRAMRTQTPVFSAKMTHVIFRPYWNVPRSILRNEILPATQRDPAYLASKGFEVTTWDGEIVSTGPASDSVLEQLQQRRLTVRQRPGPGNSLGFVKLMFPNENNVYLHDTPARSLFARARRDFSHGCIRVEKPAELTAWVLRDNPGWTLEKVQQAMQGGNNNVTVHLATPVPVFIVYGTALAYENGEVHFSDDIYGFDSRLAAALARGDAYQ
ncbi:MAG: murein L,D-transpeptidase [Acidobacteriota bacterium]